MQAMKHFLSLFIVLSLTVAGIPFIYQQDVNKDRKVDLQDAIVLARGVVRTVESSGSFASRIADAITALQKVADVTPNIEHDDSPASCNATNLGVYLPPDRPVIRACSVEGRVDSFFSPYTSITPVPIPHPPRA